MTESINQQVARLKAEEEAKAAAEPTKRVTDCYRWSGDIGSLASLIQALRFVGLAADLQIKLVTISSALRISDYTTRATAEPGEYFWLEGDIIRSGDHTDWKEAKQKAEERLATNGK